MASSSSSLERTAVKPATEKMKPATEKIKTTAAGPLSTSLFLTKTKTAVGETSQLCRKILVTQNGKQVEGFQPLTNHEVAQIFKQTTRINEVKASTAKAPLVIQATGNPSTAQVPLVIQTTGNPSTANFPLFIKATGNPSTAKAPLVIQATGNPSFQKAMVDVAKQQSVKTSTPGATVKPGSTAIPSTQGAFATLQALSGQCAVAKPGLNPTLSGLSSSLPELGAKTLILSSPTVLQSVESKKKVGDKKVVFKVTGQSVIDQLKSNTGQSITAIGTQKSNAGQLGIGKTIILSGLGAAPGGKPLEEVRVNVPSNTNENRTYTLRKIPGTNRFTVEAIVKQTGMAPKQGQLIRSGTAGGTTHIPVGKVLPLQLSTSQASAVQKTGTPTNQVGSLQSVFKTASSADRTLIVTKGILPQTSAASFTAKGSDAIVQSVSSAGTLSAKPDGAVIQNLVGAPMTSSQPSADLIPMKITAVSETGDEVSVSRVNIEKSGVDDVTESRGTEKCDGGEVSMDTGENGGKVDIVDQTRSSKSTGTVSSESGNNATNVELDKEAMPEKSTSEANTAESLDYLNKDTLPELDTSIPTLKNVFARVYLAPEHAEETTSSNVDSTDATANTSLKIGSVFSLNDDQKKAFFPETNNNDISGELDATQKTTSMLVRVKKEPGEDGNNVDERDNQNQFESTSISVKSEPQSPSDVNIKPEPIDDYVYSNYPIPDSDSDSESTDTAEERTPKKIKEEPKESESPIARLITLAHSTPPASSIAPSNSSASNVTRILYNAASASTQPAVTASHSTPVIKKPVVVSGLAPPASASCLISMFAQKKAGLGNTMVVGGKRLSSEPLNGVVTDASGKKYLIVSKPEKRVVKVPSQGGVKGQKASTGKSYIVTMSNGQKRLIHLPDNAPASALLASLMKDQVQAKIQTASVAGKASLPGIARQAFPRTQTSSSLNKRAGRVDKQSKAVKKSVLKSALTSTMPQLQTEVADDNRRRSARERKNKRRYSPPPIGPRKRQYASMSPPVLEKESDSKITDSSDTENSSDEDDDQTRGGGAVDKPGPEPAPLTPAVASREERMRLLKDLIREKEAALEEMRKKRERERERVERENDPDLMDL